MGLDALSDLVLTVGVDLTPVEQGLQELPTVARDAAAQIDAALGTIGSSTAIAPGLRDLADAIGKTGTQAQSAAQPLGLFDSAMGQITQDLMRLRSAVSDAQSNLNTIQHAFDTGAASAGQLADAAGRLRQAYQDLNGPTREAAQATEGFGTRLMELAGALGIVITIEKLVESMKEIGTAAIESFAGMERFETEMTRLTGSTETAHNALVEMKTLALTKPFEFEELAKAEQRMTAFGISTGKITETMRAAMDAAAATGNSFTLISNALERVEVTGSINARQLNQLGVSWEDLAHTAGRSVSEIQEAVKKGGEGAAYDMDLLVKTIESKFAGAADALAGTLAGQFRILKNEITVTLGDLGSSLAPMLHDLMTAFQDSLLPAIQRVVEAFKDAGPVLEALGGSMHFLVTQGSEVIRAIGNVTEVIGVLGKRAQEAANIEINALQVALLSLGAKRSTLDSIGEGAQTVWEKFWQWSSISGQINEVAGALANFDLGRAQLADLEAKLKAGAITIDQYTIEVDKLKKEQDNYAAVAAKTAGVTEKLTESARGHISALAELHGNYVAANKELDKARTVYQQIQSSVIGAAEKTELLAKQQEVINRLWKTADPVEYAAHVKELKDAHDAAKNAAKQHAETIAQLNADLVKHQAALATAKQTLDEAKAGYDAAKASGEGVAQALAIYTAAISNYEKALKAADPMAQLHVQTLSQMSLAYDQAQLKVELTAKVLDEARASLDQIRAASGDTADSVQMLGFGFGKTQQRVIETKDALDAAHGTLNRATAAHGDLARAIALVQKAEEDHLAAQQALDKAMGRHVASLAELGEKYDILKREVEDATKLVNEASAAYDGSAKSAQLLKEAHEILEKKLEAIGQGHRAASEAVKGHTESLHEHTTAIHGATSATQSHVQSLQSHVQSLQELERHQTDVGAALRRSTDVLEAAIAGYKNGTVSLGALNLAEEQFLKHLKDADPAMRDNIKDLRDLVGAYDSAAKSAGHVGSAVEAIGAAAKSAGKEMLSLGQQLDITMGGMNGALHGVIANMQQLLSMFGGYQSPLGLPSGITSMGPGYSSAGMNETIVGGVVISASQVDPGTMAPGIRSSGGSSGSGSSTTSGQSTTPSSLAGLPLTKYSAGQTSNTGTYQPAQSAEQQASNIARDIADAAADPLKIAADAIVRALDNIAGIGSSGGGGEGRHGIPAIQDAADKWTEVTKIFNDLIHGDLDRAVAELMRAGYSLEGATAVIESTGASYLNMYGERSLVMSEDIATWAGLNAKMTGVMTEAATAVLHVAQTLAGPSLVASGPIPSGLPGTSAPSAGPSLVGGLDRYGNYTGGPTSAPGPLVGVTISAGTVVGNNGMKQLSDMVANTIVDQLRRSGVRFG